MQKVFASCKRLKNVSKYCEDIQCSTFELDSNMVLIVSLRCGQTT